MALIRVISTGGTSMMVHTSQFDQQYRPRLPTSTWVDVWKRFDPREEPIPKEHDHG